MLTCWMILKRLERAIKTKPIVCTVASLTAGRIYEPIVLTKTNRTRMIRLIIYKPLSLLTFRVWPMRVLEKGRPVDQRLVLNTQRAIDLENSKNFKRRQS
jgi:hypothetical protein